MQFRVQRRTRLKRGLGHGEHTERLLSLYRLISSSLNAETVLYAIVEEVAAYIRAERASIILVEPEAGRARVLVTRENPELKNLILDLRKYPEIRKVLETRVTVAVDDLSRHPLFEEVRSLVSGLAGTSVLVVPILWDEEVVGTLFLRASRSGRPFTRDEISFCESVAAASVGALRNAHVFRLMESERQRFQELAITDAMTGVYNHAYFYMRLQEEFSRTVRYRAPLSVIMFDVDGFKRVNDERGHLVGDTVLREMAGAVAAVVRCSDLLARYGGDEFVLILPNTGLEGARTEAERICAQVRKVSIGELAGGPSLTVSAGVASTEGGMVVGPLDLLGHADAALYAAKSAGRDTVRIYEEHLLDGHREDGPEYQV